MEEFAEKLRDVFILLDPDDSSACDQQRKEDLAAILDHFNSCSKRLSDYYKLQNQYTFCNLVHRFMYLLRECLLTHQWPQVLKLVITLSNESKGQESTIWKAGLTSLFQEEERNSHLIQQFVNQLYVLKKISVVEIMLDYLLYLLLKMNIEEAKELVQELRIKTMYNTQQKNSKTPAHTLFFAYQGLVLYAEWKMALMKIDEQDDEMDIISQKLSQGGTINAARLIADSAVDYLLTIEDLPGVWDIFISRAVEIYEYYGSTEQARKLLNAYRDRNPTNPNAHRYLYEFEKNQEENQEIQFDCLNQIMKLDPSNSFCLQIYKLLEEVEDYDSVIYLFDFLDYEHCCYSEEVWEALAVKLQKIEYDSFLADIVKKQWDLRKDWWPLTRLKISSDRTKVTPNCQFHIQKARDILFNLEKLQL